MSTHLQALRTALDTGSAVLVVGSGVSAASTDGASTATWTGLIEHAISYIEAHVEGSESWAALVRAQLQVAADGADPDQLEQAANQVGLKLSKLGEQAYANWLDESIGILEITNLAVIAPLTRIDAPIVTTNYDELLERHSGRPGCDWTNEREIHRAIVGGSGIAHLHGRLSNPTSVILTTSDYMRQQNASAVQALQRAVSATKSLIYIGCGGTLEDPNFSRLLEWHRITFQNSAIQHFRLCRESELPALLIRHADDNIVPISFGANHRDLGPFLETIAPSEQVSDSVVKARDFAANSRELIVNDLAEDNLLLKEQQNVSPITIESAITPPILLTTPPGALPAANGDEEAPVRSDARADAQSSRPLLVVSEEGAGLTTALRWLLYHRSEQYPTDIPTLVVPRALPKGHNPLRKHLQQQQYTVGAIDTLTQEPVSAIVAIDDFPASKILSGRIVEDVLNLPNTGLIIIGCQLNNQAATLETLKAAGIDPDVRYLGKITSLDIRAMVSQVAPTRAKEISRLVSRTIRREHLPRTPLNASILISILLRGEQLALASSPSLILDQYVAHLLGRDEVSADSRTGLSAADRDVLLWELAIRFIELDTGSITEIAAVETLAEAIERYGWDENPSEVIEDLATRKILRRQASQISFAQSTYLHLFAAKAAARRANTKGRLLNRPLYYAAVLRSYAGLIRHDQEVLSSISSLLDDVVDQPNSSVFDEIELIDAPTVIPEHPELNPEVDDASERAADDSGDLLDSFDDSDVTPFPSKQDDELTGLPRRAQSLSLVSTVLRDSEEVEDLDLKAAVLTKALRGWAQLTDAMLHDAMFLEVAEKIRSESATFDLHEDEVNRLIKVIPALVAYTGLASSLASRKLLRILQRANRDGALESEVEASLGAAMLLHATDHAEWSGMTSYIRPWMQRQFTQEFIVPLLLVAFIELRPGDAQEASIRSLIADVAVARMRFESERHKRAYIDALYKKLDSDKRQFRRDLAIGANGS